MKQDGEYDQDQDNEALEDVGRLRAEVSQNERSDAEVLWASLPENTAEVPLEIVLRYVDAYVRTYDFDSARDVVQRHLASPERNAAARQQLSIIDSAEARKYTPKVSRTNKNNTFKVDEILGKPFARISELSACSIRGWAKIPEGKDAYLTVETPTERKLFAFNKVRNDVRAYFLRRGQAVSPDCGFSYKIDVRWGAKLGVVLDGQTAYEAEISLEQAVEVIEGKDGWLFLANDSNRSLDQFTGKVRLTATNQESWAAFGRELACLQNFHPTAYLIANSKERVVPELYPYPESDESIADQVGKILSVAACRYVNPKAALRRHDHSFYKTDTHWSDLGAYIAYQEVLRSVDYAVCDLPGIAFVEEDAVGDLGSKLSPPVVGKRLRHVYKQPGAITRVFDNALTGTGRIQVFLNDHAKYDQTALLFGGSSLTAGSFYKYFTYQFRRVVTVTLPGSAIMSIIRHERPNVIVIQTNERYLRVPGKIYSDMLLSPIPKRLESLSPFKRKAVVAAVEASDEGFYKRMFLEMAERLAAQG